MVIVLLIVLLTIALVVLWRRTQRHSSAEPLRVFRPRDVVDVDHSPTTTPALAPEETPYWLVIDTETFDPIDSEAETDAPPSPVVELSWSLLATDGTPISEAHHILRRTGQMPPEATALHGITNEHMHAGIAPEGAYRALLSTAQRATAIVGHHLDFHLRMIRSDIELLGLDGQALERLHPYCTMQIGRDLGFKRRYDGTPAYPRLGELFAYLYYRRLRLTLSYSDKGLHDIRLVGACLRRLLSERVLQPSCAPTL